MSSNLENIWKDVTTEMPRPVSEWWWALLVKKYDESNRNCHNYQYLQEKFYEFENVKHCIKNANAFALALFFQYFECNPRDSECYLKNIESFHKFAIEAAISEESAQYIQVKYLLEASAIHSTEEHKTEGAYGEDDLHYFLDLDMAVLGSPQEQYAQYIKNLESEYSFLDSTSYKNLRKKVLQSFLLIPNIFATKEFREKIEEKARKNIQEELNNLLKS